MAFPGKKQFHYDSVCGRGGVWIWEGLSDEMKSGWFGFGFVVRFVVVVFWYGIAECVDPLSVPEADVHSVQ